MVILLSLTCVILVFGLLASQKELSTTKAQSEKFQNELLSSRATHSNLRKTIENLQAQIKKLQKWSQYVDAEAQAQEMITKARQTYNEIVEHGKKEIQTSQEQANEILTQAQNQRETIIKNAEQYGYQQIAQAKQYATGIVQQANEQLEKANGVFGDAVASRDQALLELNSYKAAISGIRRQIEGYGSEYLVSADSLIDWMAEEFGNTDVGKATKTLRSKIKNAITQNEAAECDYAENYRRDVAKRFVTDAFWGKVESVMAKVKKNNFGILQQEIQDSYYIINTNGQAFRNARITHDFLVDCVQQVKLMSALNELKEQQKEEQRAIKEKMREEEKAQKEIEKAMKDAAKKEAELQKEMEREQAIIRQAQEEMRRKMEAAGEEQRAALQAEFEAVQRKHQQDLEILNQKLSEAEAKNQRALSMAQQTRAGNVYIISNIGSFGENIYKIGMTRRLEPLDRVKELGDASVPFSFDVHAMIYSEDAPALETALHKKFALSQVNKVNHRKEFFCVSIADLRKELDSMGVETTWTMLAEAHEYYETKSIEKSFEEDPAAKFAWINRQFILSMQDTQSEEESEEDS